MRGAALIAGCAFLGACTQFVPRDAQNFKVDEQDFQLIADASIKIVERSKAVNTIVVRAELDRRALDAFRKLRPVVKLTEVQQTSELALPEGYFVIDRFSIDEDVAQFEGEIGPITQAAKGKNMPGCGLGFSMAFFWEINVWRSHSYKIVDCATTRSWTPVD